MGLLNLFRPKWKHSDADVRIEAIGGISDARTLADIVVADSEWFVRHEAFAKLRSLEPDQGHYARLMRESNDEEIRRQGGKDHDRRDRTRAGRQGGSIPLRARCGRAPLGGASHGDLGKPRPVEHLRGSHRARCCRLHCRSNF